MLLIQGIGEIIFLRRMHDFLFRLFSYQRDPAPALVKRIHDQIVETIAFRHHRYGYAFPFFFGQFYDFETIMIHLPPYLLSEFNLILHVRAPNCWLKNKVIRLIFQPIDLITKLMPEQPPKRHICSAAFPVRTAI